MISLIPFLLGQSTPLATPYAQTSPLAISDVGIPDGATRWQPVELRVAAGATYSNPFDPDDVALDAQITPPDGAPYSLPGFYTRDFTRSGDVLSPGDQGWRIRLTPQKAGTYRLKLTLRDRTGSVSRESTVNVADAAGSGFVQLAPQDRRYFQTKGDGASFYPIGANVAWGGKGLADYETWFPKYRAAGANWARVWLSPAWTTFGLEQKGAASEGKGLGQFNLENAYRLDEALRLGRKNGLYLQLCIESYNVLRNADAAPFWEQTPHNRDNGGPLRIWTDFWTSPTMDRLFRNKLRYVVARYGAMPNVFAWELWNEVDLTRDFDVTPVRTWHEKMARALRELDPYDHPVTTSFANSNGFREIDLLPELDFVQTHHYGPDPTGAAAWQQIRKASWNKAHFVGEIGADSSGPRPEDTRGVQIHDPLWASICSGASGGAMPWWWDGYIEPQNHYGIFRAARNFVDGVDWPSEGFRQARPTVSWAQKPKVAPMRDAVLQGGPVSWDRSAANRPQTVRFAGGKFSGKLPLSGILHGTGNHRDLYNPVQFQLSLPRATRFTVEVGNVSGYGGGALRIWLDGKRVLTREFRDPDDDTKTEDLTQYAGTYGITVPAGNHVVVVENFGRDWFQVSYRLTGAARVTKPNATVYAVTGNTRALVWLKSDDATWRNEVLLKRKPTPVPSTIMRLPGLSAGSWRVEHWDTWSGKRVRQQYVGVGVNGVMRLQVPAFSRDVALRLIRDANR